MKTINFEISKKLNDLGYLDNIETEFMINEISKKIMSSKSYNDDIDYGKPMMWWIKTPTLEEAIEFLPSEIKVCSGVAQSLSIKKYGDREKKYGVIYDFCGRKTHQVTGKTLLEAIEKMIEYLIDNNLLGKIN